MKTNTQYDGGDGQQYPIEPEPIDKPTDTRTDVLSFSINGDWGHFRRVEGNTVKQTYRIIPRTTVAGIIAAICGYDRDSYYDHFTAENADIAVTPVTELRTMNMMMNTLPTAHGNMTTIHSADGATLKSPMGADHRKQHNYECLVDPEYRIDIRLASESVYQTLKHQLENNNTAYPISLGKSEYLASIKYNGEFEATQLTEDVHDIDSAIPDGIDAVVPTADCEIRTEQSPTEMKMNSGRRRMNGRTPWVYSPTAESIPTKSEPFDIGGEKVLFS